MPISGRISGIYDQNTELKPILKLNLINKIIYLYKYLEFIYAQVGKDKQPIITSACELNSNVFLLNFSIKYKPIKHPIKSIKAPILVNNVDTELSPASEIIKFEYTKKISIPIFLLFFYFI